MELVAWLNFLLVFARVGSFMVTLPFTGYRGIPNLYKAFVSLVIAWLIFTGSGASIAYLDAEVLSGPKFIVPLAGEVLTGLALGFVVLLVFSIFRAAGQLIDIHVGIGMANVFDPQFGGTVTLLGQFYYLLAIVIYFGLNGHHYLLLSLSESFAAIPLGGVAPGGLTMTLLLRLFSYTWSMAFQVAAPIVAAVAVTDISLGLISKTVPQLHVFLVGLPLKVFVGLLVVYLTLPYISLLSADIFDRLYKEFIHILGSVS